MLIITSTNDFSFFPQEMVEEPESEKAQRIESIQNLYAFDLFCQKRFEESLQRFAQLETDPTQVIGLFPDLLPIDFRKQLEYPAPPPNLLPGEFEKGCLALVEYLTQVSVNGWSD